MCISLPQPRQLGASGQPQPQVSSTFLGSGMDKDSIQTPLLVLSYILSIHNRWECGFSMLSYRCIYWFSVDIERKELSQIFLHYLLNKKSIFWRIAILKKAMCENQLCEIFHQFRWKFAKESFGWLSQSTSMKRGEGGPKIWSKHLSVKLKVSYLHFDSEKTFFLFCIYI